MFTDTDKQEFDAMIKGILESNGISRNTSSYRDYERAKRLLPDLTSYKYTRAIVIICRWINL